MKCPFPLPGSRNLRRVVHGAGTTALALSAFAACSGSDVAPTVANPPLTSGMTGAGTGSGATGGTTGAGGTVNAGGTGGMPATGGSAAVSGAGGGGATTSSGGAGDMPGSGGSGGQALGGMGAVGMGGMSGPPLGGMSAGGNADPGGAGNGPTGGMAGAGALAGSGGMATGGSGGASCPSVADLFPSSGALGSLDGRLVTTPCSPTNSDDCSGGGWIYEGTTTPCMGGALTAQQDFAVGGTPGTVYHVTMHFYGVMEPKNYGNMVTREAGATRPMNMPNGATPAPFAEAPAGVSYPASDYNTYEIHILDENDEEVHQYFINSDTAEGHWTYRINYERELDVVGGGHVRMRTYDRNCRMIKNCGDRTGNVSVDACRAATKQTIDTSAAMPPPTALKQPGLGQSDDQSGQWFLLDVVKVACD